jgi:hypothetical protein
MEEVWKDIEGYEGYYQVSNLGRVRSLDRIVPHKIYKFMNAKGKILCPGKVGVGYYTVALCNNSKPKSMFIHRLVAEAFISKTSKTNDVNHKNGIKTDNRLENLEWCTRSENTLHAFTIGLKSHVGELHNLSKLTEEQAKEIKYELKELSVKQISVKYNVHVETIYSIRRGSSWKHI